MDEKWRGLTSPVSWLMNVLTNFCVSDSMNFWCVSVNSLFFSNERECISHGRESTAYVGKSKGWLFGVIVVVTLLCFANVERAYERVWFTSFLYPSFRSDSVRQPKSRVQNWAKLV